MSKLDFRGIGAGLGKKLGGDAHDITSYILTCGCGLELGPLGGHRTDEEGRRCVGCPQCQMATVLDKNGQVIKFVPISSILELQQKAAGG